MTYLHADYGNPYDYMNERMEKSEYINDYRLKLNNELKRALVNHGISINMLDTFIKILDRKSVV